MAKCNINCGRECVHSVMLPKKEKCVDCDAKDKRIVELEEELKQWKWKCNDVLVALSAIQVVICDFKVRDSAAKADGSRTI